MNTRTKWLTSKDYQCLSEDLRCELTKFLEENEKCDTEELIDFFESFLNEYRIIVEEDDITPIVTIKRFEEIKPEIIISESFVKGDTK